jgi:hypothetical protein
MTLVVTSNLPAASSARRKTALEFGYLYCGYYHEPVRDYQDVMAEAWGLDPSYHEQELAASNG